MSAAVLEPHQCPGSVTRAPVNRLQLYTQMVSRMPFVFISPGSILFTQQKLLNFLTSIRMDSGILLGSNVYQAQDDSNKSEGIGHGVSLGCESWSLKIFPVLTPGSTLLQSSLSKDFLLQSSGPASPWARFSFFLDFNFLVTKWRCSFCIPHILQKRLGQGGGPGVGRRSVYERKSPEWHNLKVGQ